MRTRLLLAGVLGAHVVSCDSPDSATPTVAYCSVPVHVGASPVKPSSTCAAYNLVVAASDYASSELGVLALDGGDAFATNEALGADPALASSHGRLFWINRTVGSIIELDPKCNKAIAGPWLVNDGDDESGTSNPQDVAVAPDGSLWVARLNESSVLILSADGQDQLCRVDLSRVTGQVRNPYASSIRIIADAHGKSWAYVALEMLSSVPNSPDEVSDGPSYVARIDVAAQKVDRVLKLEGRDPLGLMVEYDGALYLAEPGRYDLTNESSAGVERVDLASFTSELIVRESDLGANVVQLSVTAGCATAIVADGSESNFTSLISFDPVTRAIVTPLSKRLLYTGGGFDLAGMAWLDGGVNVVGDRTPGGSGFAVHVLQASAGCVLTARPSLSVPQRPLALQPTP